MACSDSQKQIQNVLKALMSILKDTLSRKLSKKTMFTTQTSEVTKYKDALKEKN